MQEIRKFEEIKAGMYLTYYDYDNGDDEDYNKLYPCFSNPFFYLAKIEKVRSNRIIIHWFNNKNFNVVTRSKNVIHRGLKDNFYNIYKMNIASKKFDLYLKLFRTIND